MSHTVATCSGVWRHTYNALNDCGSPGLCHKGAALYLFISVTIYAARLNLWNCSIKDTCLPALEGLIILGLYTTQIPLKLYNNNIHLAITWISEHIWIELQ